MGFKYYKFKFKELFMWLKNFEAYMIPEVRRGRGRYKKNYQFDS